MMYPTSFRVSTTAHMNIKGLRLSDHAFLKVPLL